VKLYAVEQGSVEWMRLRCGLPTASNFDRIVTASGKASASAKKYLSELCAEWLLGGPVNPTETQFMERGKQLEPEARAWFEWEYGVTVEPGGFITSDDGRIGCSPDGLIGDDEGFEAKCFEYTHHVMALLELDDEHRCQIQGCLWLTERERWHRVYFNPALPPVVVTLERDEEFIEKLAAGVETFAEHLAAAKERLLSLGCKPIVTCPATGISELICRCERCEGRR